MYQIEKQQDGETKTIPIRFKTRQEASHYLLSNLALYKGCTNAPDIFQYTLKEITGDVTDRIKSYEDACAEIGAPIDIPGKKFLRPDEVARRKLEVIVAALNEGWKPDWNNTEQYKWYPYFLIEPRNGSSAGLAASTTYYSASYTYALFGSRLCFKSSALAQYAGETFTDLYREMILQ